MPRLSQVIFIAMLTACGEYDKSLVVSDVTKEQVIVLAKTAPGNTHSYAIRGTGNIQGRATLSLMLNGKPYKIENLEGRVSFTWGGDFYADAAEILYRPENVTGGTLKLEYSFSTL